MALVALALLLCLPASSFAAGDTRGGGSRTEQGESPVTALESAGLLARGSGYRQPAGSKAVRQLQLRLRGLGHRPGPIDGLFGPLTEASVERFQRARGLEVDGLVGARTRARLLAVPVRRRAAPQGSARPEPGAPDRVAPNRPAPNRPAPADVAPPRDLTPDAVPERPAAREPGSSDGMEPWLAALVGALATGILFAGLSRLLRPRRGESFAQRQTPAPRSHRSGLNLGMAFAVLLAVFAMGAAIGALFASRAAPGDRDGGEVAGGALLSPPAAPPARDPSLAEPPPKSVPRAAAPRRAPPPSPAPETSTPAPGPTIRDRAAPQDVPATGPAAAPSAAPTTAPSRPATQVDEPSAGYTARPDASASSTPEQQPEAGSSDTALAQRVRRLIDLEDRFASGDPDLLTAGRQSRQP
jgi:Putative peptidoglycan binding domain